VSAGPSVSKPPVRDCQSFAQGCVGCCVNARWSPQRMARYLEANTKAAEAIFPVGRRPGRVELLRMHWRRGGWLDHGLAALLAVPTLGLTAFLWRTLLGSCCFAGYIDRATGRAGCLLHPARLGLPDLRRFAFPYVPTLGCDRALRCPLLDDARADAEWDLPTASRAGFESLRKRNRLSRRVSESQSASQMRISLRRL
jgi:hypothetical protein